MIVRGLLALLFPTFSGSNGQTPFPFSVFEEAIGKKDLSRPRNISFRDLITGLEVSLWGEAISLAATNGEYQESNASPLMVGHIYCDSYYAIHRRWVCEQTAVVFS
jgi:hypothetical protein